VRVAGIQSVGGPVELIDVPDPPAPTGDEVLIEVRAAGVANWDDVVRRGDWEVGIGPPMALGVEAAGVVAAVGDSVGGFSAGDEVLTHPLPLRDQGAWAAALLAPAAQLARKPESVSWAAAGAFPVPALTAAQAIDEALGVAHGETLLVNGAGGVTGSLLVSFGAVRGAEVIAIAGSEGHEYLRSLGAAQVLDYHDGAWPDEVRRITGGTGVDLALNAVPGGSADAIGVVHDGGRLVTITSDQPDPQRGISASTLYVRPDGPRLQEMVELLAADRLAIRVGSTFSLTDAGEALATAVRGNGGRAVVIEI
jgi:NADPH:quinone reductase-like Zn-dependent oxidoreductase